MSKKLCLSIVGIQAIVGLSADTPDKFWYAVLVLGVVVVYKVIQAVLDRKKDENVKS